MTRNFFTILILCLLSLTAHAQLEIRFNGDTIPASGQLVDVDVVVSKFTDVVAMQFSINWDPEVFNFSSIENVTTVLEQFSEAANIGTPPSALAVDDGELTISWSLTSTEPVTIPDGTRLFTLRLFGVGANCTSTQLRIASAPLIIEVVDQDFAPITVNANTANLRIDDGTCSGGGGGGGNMDGVGLIVDDQSVTPGANICIPVKTRNFRNVGSLQTGVKWDPTVLRFTELKESSLTNVTANRGREAMGELSLLWLFQDAAVTLADNSTMFELCFDVIGNTGSSSTIDFVGFSGFDIEISDNDSEALPFFVDAGTITVGSGGGGNETGVGLIAGNIFTGNQSNVCIGITTRDFTDIAGLQLGVSFDPAILTYTGSNNVGLMTNVLVGTVDAALGRLRVLWTVEGNTQRVDLPDDAVLFELCFDVIGTPGQRTPIGFVNLPSFPIEVSNSSGTPLEFFLRDGSITVGDNPNANQVELSSSSSRVAQGDTTCVDIQVRNFSNIGALGFTLAWDSTILRHVRQQNFNLPNLSGGTTNFNLLNAGQLRLVWTPPSAQSVPDATSIFQVCYEAIGSCELQGSTMISFIGNSGGAIEVINAQSQAVPFTLRTGTVTIDTCAAGGRINLLALTNPTCNADVDGAIAVDFSNFNGMVFCRWTNAAGNQVSTNCNLVGVGAGTYTLRAIDEDSMQISRTFTVTAPSPISLASVVNNVNCITAGSIALTPSGGSGAGYRYAWSGGLPATATVSNLNAGTFMVTVSDGNNCSSQMSFTVADETSTISLDNFDVITCPDDLETGIIQINLSGGTGGYAITSSSGTATTSGRITGLTNLDPLTLIVTDGAGCQMMFNDIDFSDECRGSGTDLCVGRSIISPNGDGVNDIFEIGCLSRGQNQPNRLEIFDRWGKMVFGSDNYDNDWSGTDFNGNALSEGGYMWILQTGVAGNRDLFRGTVSILR